MTASQEPLVMTLEEAIEALYPYSMELRAESLTGEGVSWSVFEFSIELGRPVLVCNGHGTWWEAVSDALGVPVVARDDAAELRAALRRCSNLIQDFLDFGVAPSDRGPARHAVDAARAALAATEGKS